MVEVAPVISIPSDMTDMAEGGGKEAVPKRAEWSVDCPTGRMVKSRATVIILDLMESYLKFYLYRNIHSPLHGMEPKGLAFRQSFYFFKGTFNVWVHVGTAA